MDEQNKVSGAIGAKYPTAGFTVGTTYDSLNWLSEDVKKPTKAEFDKAIADYETEYNALAWKRSRQAGYPSVGDQLDMLMKDMKNGTKTHQAACEAVKTKYPKS